MLQYRMILLATYKVSPNEQLTFGLSANDGLCLSHHGIVPLH